MTSTADAASLRRERGLALAAMVAGAVLTLTVGGRTWATVRVEAAAGLPALPQDVTGTDLAGPLPALGLVGLAAVAAVLATRGVARALIGGLVVATGVAVAAYGVDGATSDASAADLGLGGRISSVSSTAWPWVAVLAGLLLALGGVVVLLRGPRWSALSRRFDAPRDQDAASVADSPTEVRTAGASHVPATGSMPATGAADADDAYSAKFPGAGGGRELWDALDRGEDPTRDGN